jgi:methionyl-tRNA synthetase
VELLRILSILIAPVLPLASAKLQEQFGFSTPQFSKLKVIQALENQPVKKGSILFAKFESKETK